MTFMDWLGFVGLWTLMTLPFGPNAVTCVTGAAANGVQRALWSVAGIALAGICHMVIAVLGFGALLLACSELFLLLKWLGIAYLLWMGLSLWYSNGGTSQTTGRPASSAALLRRGFLTSMSNPKAILSYMAVFPQFIVPDAPLAEQLTILMPTSTAILLLVYGGYSLAGGGLARWLTNARRRRLFNRAAGSSYVFCAAALAATDARRP